METKFDENLIGIFDDNSNKEMFNGLIEWFDILNDSGITNPVYGPNDEIRAISQSSSPDNTSSVYKNNPSWNPRTRRDTAVSIPQIVPSKYMNIFLTSKYKAYVSECLIKYIEHYSLILENPISVYGFKINKVLPSQGYHAWHYENGTEWNRAAVFMTYLTDVEEGGETEFLYQSKRIKPVVGRTLIWPAGYTHVHRGNTPIKGEKIYATGWFEYT